MEKHLKWQNWICAWFFYKSVVWTMVKNKLPLTSPWEQVKLEVNKTFSYCLVLKIFSELNKLILDN